MRSRCTLVVYTVGSLVGANDVHGIATVRRLVVVVRVVDFESFEPLATLPPPVVSRTV